MKQVFIKQSWVGLITLLIGILAVPAFWSVSRSGYSTVYAESGSIFKIRVLRKSDLLLNYSHLFQTANSESSDWRDVFEITSDPIPFLNENIDVVDENTGFIWAGRTYSVTLDGGRTWNYFNLTSENVRRESLDCTWIEEVKLRPDGRGEMGLRGCAAGTRFTEDFGITWTEASK